MRASLVLLVSLLALAWSVQGYDDHQVPYEGFMRAFPHANISLLLDLPEEMNQQALTYIPTPVSCPSIPAPAPTNNINNLKPGHIKVVMAMGDSITAGSSIHDDNILFMSEYRGLSFSIGQEANYVTLPNLLRPCVDKLTGGSTGVGTDRNRIGNGFNAAVSGAKNKDMQAQAQWLVEKLRAELTTDQMNNDWKVLTIWIGSNNLCDVCNDAAGNDAANYELHLKSALSFLYSYVPRLLVNLVPPLDVATLWNIEGVTCSTIHFVACPCAGSPFSDVRAKVSRAAKEYQARTYAIASHFNGRKDTFAVAVQPFLIETVIKDRSLLSSADCFHPSLKGHTIGAVALWNNMLTPSALKKKSWNEADAPICPTVDSKIYID